MPTTISYTSFDFDAVTIVPVIASFNIQGHICPLYVKIGETSYRIESYTWTSHYGHILDFTCRIRDGNCCKPLSLTYHANENMWTIPAAGEAPPLP